MTSGRLRKSEKAAPESQGGSIREAAGAFRSKSSCRDAIIIIIDILVIVLVRSLEAGLLAAPSAMHVPLTWRQLAKFACKDGHLFHMGLHSAAQTSET